MERGRIVDIQEAFKALDLQPGDQRRVSASEKDLVGKVLTTRTFRRYTISEIVAKTWKVKSSLRIESLGNNIFKFSFGSMEDREKFFRGRPWSLNGAHIVLKEWDAMKVLQDISFDSSTFTMQIHGLPPAFLHEGTAKKIGDRVGEVHNDSINRRCVVHNRYIRFRIDINITKPLPAGFFQERTGGKDLWIQFKFERLSDFCFKCGSLEHVTGKCNFDQPAIITSSLGISAQVYGPWLKAENPGSTLFVNPVTETGRGNSTDGIGHIRRVNSMISAHSPKKDSFNEILEGSIENYELVHFDSGNSRSNPPQKEFLLSLETCPELKALALTLKKEEWGTELDLQAAVIRRIKELKWNSTDLSNWATGVLKSISSYRACERRRLIEAHLPIELEGFGPPVFTNPKGLKQAKEMGVAVGKRAAPCWLESPCPKASKTIESNDELEEVSRTTSLPICAPEEEEEQEVRHTEPRSPLPLPDLEFHEGSSEGINRPRTRFWSWKREARRRERAEGNRGGEADGKDAEKASSSTSKQLFQ